MKSIHRKLAVIFAIVEGFTGAFVSAQELPTTGSFDTRLGKLELQNGFPTDATVVKIFEDIDYQRACQAYLWALPMMAMQQWQQEHLNKF
jgi:hypothetical protein